MPVCKECEDEVDEVVRVKVDGKTQKLCEDCADIVREQLEIAEASQDAMREMMEYKGR